MAHFYSEDGEEIERKRLVADECIEADATLKLKRHQIEIGQLEACEESVDELFRKLNAELGIEMDGDAYPKTQNTRQFQKIQRDSESKEDLKGFKKLPPKQATKVSSEDEKSAMTYDILFSQDKVKKNKIWHDGFLRYYSTSKIGEFYSDQGRLFHKKVMNEIKLGEVFESANYLFEISGEKSSNSGKESNENLAVKADENLAVKTNENLAVKADENLAVKINKNLAVKINKNLAVKTKEKSKKFQLLFTTDKLKKSKRWIDGILEISSQTGSVLCFSDENRCIFKKLMALDKIFDGAEFESGQYLFQVSTEVTEDESHDLIPTPIHESKMARISQSTSEMASTKPPITGRSDCEILALLGKKVEPSKCSSEINQKLSENSHSDLDDLESELVSD